MCALAILGLAKQGDTSSYGASLFVLGSLAAAAGAARDREKRSQTWLDGRWLPFVAGALALLASIAMWRALAAQEQANLDRLTHAKTEGVRSAILGRLAGLGETLRLLALEGSRQQLDRDSEWASRLLLSLERLEGVLAIEWIDPRLDAPFRIAPPGLELGPPPQSLGEPEPPSSGLSALGDLRVTRAFPLRPDGFGFRLIVPVPGEQGQLAAVVDARRFFETSLAVGEGQDFVRIEDSGQEIYRKTRSDAEPGTGLHDQVLAMPGGAVWALELAPSAQLVESVLSPVPSVALVLGIVISGLIVATMASRQTERQKTKELSAALRRLETEMQQRRAAEKELQDLNDELEQRVRERTLELSEVNVSLAYENDRRRRIEQYLTRMNANLRQFDAFISHELRQPLAAMQIWIELLESYAEKAMPEKQRGYLRKARDEIYRMGRLIESELELSKATHGDPPTEVVRLGPLVEEVVEQAAPAIRERSGRVEVGELPDVIANPVQMRQLFTNLLDNALKYARPDEPPMVIIERAPAPSENGLDEILVRDNGRGLAEADCKIIFEPFRRNEAKAQGSGLGLAICRRIVEHHGGSIWCEGEPGQGSIFHVALPSAREERVPGPAE